MSDIQESFQVLTEIDRLLAAIELKITKIEGKAPQTRELVDSFRQLERLAVRWLVLAQQVGLPPDMNKAINTIARLIILIRMLQMSLSMMTGGGWIRGLTGLAGFAGAMGVMSSGSLFEGY